MAIAYRLGKLATSRAQISTQKRVSVLDQNLQNVVRGLSSK